jgi:uncharacterized protein YjbI with pentapeptide repeats
MTSARAGRLAATVVIGVAGALLVLLGCTSPPALVLTGQVLHRQGGAPAAGVEVTLFRSDTETVVARTTTSAEGAYAFDSNVAVDGTYRLRFGDATWYPAASSWATAGDVVVARAQPIRVDGAVANGSVSGTVTRASGASMFFNYVAAIDAQTNATVASVAVASSGAYRFASLPDGSYRFRFTGGGQTTRYQFSATAAAAAAPIAVRAGHEVTGVDTTLDAGSSLFMTLEGLDVPITGVEAVAWPEGESISSGVPDATGRVVLPNLSARPYRIRFTLGLRHKPLAWWGRSSWYEQPDPGEVIPLWGGAATGVIVRSVHGVDCDPATMHQGASLPGANLAGKSLFRCPMESMDLHGADLRGATMGWGRFSNLNGSQLADSDWSYGSPEGVTFVGATSGGVSGFPATLGWNIHALRRGYIVGPGVNLRGVDLSAPVDATEQLGSFDLSGADLTEARLTGQVLSSANLAGANLTNAALGNAVLTRVRSGGIVGAPATLPVPWRVTQGYLVGPTAMLDGAALAGAPLAGATLTDASLVGANLTHASLGTADLTNVSLVGADLSDADLTGARLRQAKLRQAHIGGARLGGADLQRVTSGELVGLPAQLPASWQVHNGYLVGAGASLSYADLHGLDAAGAVLSDTVLTGANLAGSNLRNTNLARADLGGADVRNSVLTGASFDGTLLLTTAGTPNFSGVASGGITGTPVGIPTSWRFVHGYFVLPMAKLVGADLRNLDLTGAQMTAVNLWNARLDGSNLTSALMDNVNLDGTALVGATLTGVRSGGITGTPASLPTGWRLVSGYLISTGADLRYADLTGADLSGYDLNGAQLRGANLTQANLTNATLIGADLTRATLTQATLSNANFSGATMPVITSGGVVGAPSALPAGFKVLRGFLAGPQAVLTGADLGGTDLAGVDLTGATMTKVRSGTVTGTPVLPSGWKLIGGYLIGPDADLSSAQLSGLDLSGCNLSQVVLTGASVSGTDLRQASLYRLQSGGLVGVPQLPPEYRLANGYIIGRDVVLTGATLSGLDLSGVDLRRSSLYGASLVGTNLSGVVLTGAFVTGSNFTGANLTGVVMDSGILSRSTFTGATMTNASFGVTFEWPRSGGIVGVPAKLPTGWVLVSGCLFGDGADVSGADLSGADLRGLVLRTVVFDGANLDGADLSGADMWSISARAATFRNATLVSTSLVSADLTGADLSGANMKWVRLNGSVVQGAEFGTAMFISLAPGTLTGTPASLPASWRMANRSLVGPTVQLYQVDLSDLDLSGVDLSGGSLKEVKLRRTILTGANLTGTAIVSIDAPGLVTGGIIGVPASMPYYTMFYNGYIIGSAVDLRGANLRGVTLVGVGLSSVDFRGADLTGADLGGTSLSFANFAGAVGSPVGGATAAYDATVCPDGVTTGATVTTCVGHGFAA